MRKLISALLLTFGMSGMVYAACSTHTYNIDGRMVVCTTCCYGNNCNTTCF